MKVVIDCESNRISIDGEIYYGISDTGTEECCTHCSLYSECEDYSDRELCLAAEKMGCEFFLHHKPIIIIQHEESDLPRIFTQEID